jgi:DMSO/TMAO reductase YedYZ molybdopterin-dependent catalytic subunit
MPDSESFFNRAVDRVTRARAAHTDPAQPTAGRVPPGQHLVPNFPVLHYGGVPRFDPARWDLRVYGLVTAPLTLSWADFGKLPTQRQVCDIHCVTTWSKLDTVWEGVPFKHIAELVQPKPEAHFVIARCEQAFTTSLPLSAMMSDDVLLATRYGDQPLTPEHGAPVRTLIPARYLWKSAKWVRALEFVAEDQLGFWERAGYNNSADPWKEERYANQ